MGWDFLDIGGEQPKDFLRRELTGGRRVCQDIAMVNRVAYAAVSTINGDGSATVSAVVVLTERRGGKFGFKTMTESMEPYYYNCPARILDMLTPTDNELALAWRRKCREQLVQRGD